MEHDSSVSIFEDQDDYIEDVKEQFRAAIKRYTLYSKSFGRPREWKMLKDELRRFVHYELESSFSKMIVREDCDGIIMMRFDDKED